MAQAWSIATARPQHARDLTDRALVQSRRIGYARGEAYGLRNLAYVGLMLSELGDALPLAEDALARLHALNDTAGVGSALDTVGLIYWRSGMYDQALQYSYEALTHCTYHDDRVGQAWAHHNRGAIFKETGDYEEAIEALEHSLALFREAAYRIGELRALSVLGEAHYVAGAYHKALSCFNQVIEGTDQVDLPLLALAAWREMGRTYAVLGQSAEALVQYERSLALFDDVDQPDAKAQTLLCVGQFHLKQGDTEAALAATTHAQEMLSHSAPLATQLEVEESLALIFEQRGDFAAALQHLRAHQRIKDHIDSDERAMRLKHVQIRRATERAEQEAEIHRLRYVELAQAQVQLIQAERMRAAERLVAGVVHELNTPLGVITASGDVVRRGLARVTGLSDSAREALQAALDSGGQAAQRLTELADRLRDFVRLDQAELQQADLNMLLRETVTVLRPEIPERIRVDLHLSEVPTLRCYPQELNQVFMTLLSNAADAIDDPLGSITVSISAGQSIQISIEDTGRGLNEEAQAHLFDIDIAKQGATMRMNIGLAMCQNIIHKHRGQITVSSAIGQGTRFDIVLPIEGA